MLYAVKFVLGSGRVTSEHSRISDKELTYLERLLKRRTPPVFIGFDSEGRNSVTLIRVADISFVEARKLPDYSKERDR